MPKISPFLWFDHQAEAAGRFYTTIFKPARILQVARYGPGGPGPAGSVMTVSFKLAGSKFTALNGGPVFKITPAISFVVSCRTQEEIDHYWKKLSAGGKKVQCGWLEDKFGVSWQIVPAELPKLLGGRDPKRAERVMQAMMGMIKLDLRRLQRAAAQG